MSLFQYVPAISLFLFILFHHSLLVVTFTIFISILFPYLVGIFVDCNEHLRRKKQHRSPESIVIHCEIDIVGAFYCCCLSLFKYFIILLTKGIKKKWKSIKLAFSIFCKCFFLSYDFFLLLLKCRSSSKIWNWGIESSKMILIWAAYKADVSNQNVIKFFRDFIQQLDSSISLTFERDKMNVEEKKQMLNLLAVR